MYRNWLYLITLVFFSFSCGKDSSVKVGAEEEKDMPVRLVVGVGTPGTRATGSTTDGAESKVNTLQVFVFKGDAVDGYGMAENTKTITVSCTSGQRDIYAVVNAPVLTGISIKDDLLSATSQLSSEISNFQMMGYSTKTVEDDTSVDVVVKRLAARVVVGGIKNSLSDPSLAESFKLISVSLTNVVADVDYGRSADYEPKEWLNRRGYEQSNPLGTLDYDLINTDVASGASYAEVHTFYSYPNAKDAVVGLEEGASGFTGRRARLVVKAEIGGVLYNYPILLPALESNKSYEITCVDIMRVGNPDNGFHNPDDGDDVDEEVPVGSGIGVKITIKNWEEATTPVSF